MDAMRGLYFGGLFANNLHLPLEYHENFVQNCVCLIDNLPLNILYNFPAQVNLLDRILIYLAEKLAVHKTTKV